MAGWSDAFDALDRTVANRAELLAAGATGRMLTTAVRSGHLVRLRRDHYSLPNVEKPVGQAVRVGGRLACVSALRSYGVFAEDRGVTHLALDPDSTRLRSAQNARRPLPPRRRRRVVAHWNDDQTAGSEYRVGLRAALRQACLCSGPQLGLASLENALHLEMIDEVAANDIISSLPVTVAAWMRPRLEPRSEAGQETILRLIVQDAGYRVAVQRSLPELGRVDMIVDDRLVFEADSRAHHDGWEAHVRDRRRDLIAAKLGFASLRPAYQHTMHHPDLVSEAVTGLLGAPMLR